MTLPLRGVIVDAPHHGRKLLHRGLVLVQFAPVLTIGDRTGQGIAAFQEDIRSEYPNIQLDLELLFHVELKPGGSPQPTTEELAVWRLSDSAHVWKLSLSRESIALEVGGDGYTNWADFAERMARVIRAVARHFAPGERQRIGVRFVNAVPFGNDSPLHGECADELLSITGGEEVIQADLAWRLGVDEGELILRSGVLMPETSHDPRVLEPSPDRRWYLDIDVVSSEVAPFDDATINEAILAQVRRVHAIYRWAVPNQVQRV